MVRWRMVVFSAVLATVPACTVWHQVPVPAPPAPPTLLSDVSRLQLRSGQSVEFLTLVVATDSLFGVRNNLGRTRMTVSLDQVAQIEVRKRDGARTAALVGAIAVGLFLSGATGFTPR